MVYTPHLRRVFLFALFAGVAEGADGAAPAGVGAADEFAAEVDDGRQKQQGQGAEHYKIVPAACDVCLVWAVGRYGFGAVNIQYGASIPAGVKVFNGVWQHDARL